METRPLNRRRFNTWLGCGLLGGAATARAEWAPQGPPARTSLVVASFPDLDRSAIAAREQWARLHPDVEVKIVSLQIADHHTAMTTALATGAGLPDVMALDFRFVGKFAASGGLEDLGAAPYNGMALRDRFERYAFAQGINKKGVLAAMPTDIGPGTLLYRKDLFDRAGVDEAELTASWESFLAAGRKLKAASGVYPLGDAGDLRDILLRAGVHDGEGLYFDADGKVLVETDRFVRAFELGLQAHRDGLDAHAPPWCNDWVAGLARGRIATQMMGSWLTGHLRNWIAPDQSGRWRSAPLPGGAFASYGGSFYAIPKKARNKPLAWEFIKLLCNDREVQLQSLRVLDSFPALLDAQHDASMDAPIPYLGGQRARLMWRDIAARVPVIPVNRYDAVATDVIRDAFEQVVTEGVAVRDALRDARVLIEHRARWR